MKPAGGVLLNDVLVAFATAELPARLGGQVKFSLSMIGLQAQNAPLNAGNLFVGSKAPHRARVVIHLER